MSHIAIFDIGKTNKKLFVFDEDYRIVFEKSEHLPETKDEDGDPCEDIHLLTNWVRFSLEAVLKLPDLQINAINFSAYGASFVYLDEHGEILTPLYNYLKPYPDILKQQFYEKYGGHEEMAIETASPMLGSLNSGMQLYRLKHERPEVYKRLKYALHLPQYLSWLITGEYYSDLTSIGCHTQLWDFAKMDYHKWAYAEGVVGKLAPFTNLAITLHNSPTVGIGLHDSSSALIPYLAVVKKPFLLLSTGTWNIALNPFNDEPLTIDELAHDCLCYLSFQGKLVKASRLFAGYELEQAIKEVSQDEAKSKGEIYDVIIRQLVDKQVVAINLVLTQNIKQIFVDGGFSKNTIFMTLLADAFSDIEVYAAEVAQASAIGAAVAIREHWNNNPLITGLVTVRKYEKS
jgi:L-fuculokinase